MTKPTLTKSGTSVAERTIPLVPISTERPPVTTVRTSVRVPVKRRDRDVREKTQESTNLISGAAMATLTYQAFAKLWKRLISRRRARELNVGMNDVWQQLVDNGRLSPRYRLVVDVGREVAPGSAEPGRAKPPSGAARPLASARVSLKRAEKRRTPR